MIFCDVFQHFECKNVGRKRLYDGVTFEILRIKKGWVTIVTQPFYLHLFLNAVVVGGIIADFL